MLVIFRGCLLYARRIIFSKFNPRSSHLFIPINYGAATATEGAYLKLFIPIHTSKYLMYISSDTNKLKKDTEPAITVCLIRYFFTVSGSGSGSSFRVGETDIRNRLGCCDCWVDSIYIKCLISKY